MQQVNKDEFQSYFKNKWYTLHKGFFKGSKRFIIDGHYIGYSEEQENIFKLNYFIIEKQKL